MALYAAKDAGRNTCKVWEPLSTDPARSASMRRVLKAGQIVFNAGRSVIDCTVRGLSQVSARLDVLSTANIPEKFKLSIADDGFSRACNITDKRNRTLEVAFI
jgi:hypothetical protein